MQEYTDEELLIQFKDENKRSFAFHFLIKKYQKQIYFHVRKLIVDHQDTDDIVQNTFIKVWKGLDHFRGDSKLYTWIYKIATNECMTFLKSKRRRFFLPFIDVKKELLKKVDSDSDTDGDEIQKKLQKAVLLLPEKQRIVFNMKYYSDMTYEEISEILGTSVGALKASYHLAVKKIEKVLIPQS